MRCEPEYAQLCTLINHSLLPHIEPQEAPKLLPLTKAKEKHLLITLSQVSTQIPTFWDRPHQSHSHHGMEQDSGDFHDCLSNIVSILVTFLTIDSQYVRHLASNILVLVSNQLTGSLCDNRLHGKPSGRDWDVFLRSLCICLEVAICNISASLSRSTSASDSDTSSFTLCARERLSNANLFTVAGLIQILRIILKHLKQQDARELLKMYMHTINYFLTSIHWESLNEIYVAQSRETLISSSDGVYHHERIGPSVSRSVFLGTLLQLLCSLAHQNNYPGIGHGTLNEHPVISKVISLVPKLLTWCFKEQEDNDWINNSQYLRHKLLMLMIRLSFQVDQEFSALFMLFQLVQRYFGDLLNLPISGKNTDLNECLEGSPFLSCLIDEDYIRSISTRHLQRQAILLFLKCAFNLISLTEGADHKHSCATSHSCLCFKLQSCQYCCTKKKVLSEISEWLQRDLHLDMSLDLVKFETFALSFLQLYMDEDDLLFEVLLQLSSSPLPFDQMEYEIEDKAFEEVKGNTVILLSNILNPVHLFHLFLAELHYDHLVLLDYLISKDTGIQCLQYLLRCLRIVCNSWNTFLQFPLCGSQSSSSLSCKKRKVTMDTCSDSSGNVGPINVRRNPGILDKGSKQNNKLNSMVDTRIQSFESAKDCLLSLKKSVENLHQKNLFLYNPAALLRSFTKFEELCLQQENVYLWETGSIT